MYRVFSLYSNQIQSRFLLIQFIAFHHIAYTWHYMHTSFNCSSHSNELNTYKYSLFRILKTHKTNASMRACMCGFFVRFESNACCIHTSVPSPINLYYSLIKCMYQDSIITAIQIYTCACETSLKQSETSKIL